MSTFSSAPNLNEFKPSALAVGIICFLYFLSGVTALSYEVLWARMLSQLFGVSIFGVAVTVSAFMAGLGLGSLTGARIVRLIRKPIVVLALIEAVVAALAFFLPALSSELEAYFTNLGNPNIFVWYGLQAVSTFLVLFIPAFLLGAGFAFIVTTLTPGAVSLGTIYGLNTAGGVLGALLPLFLMPLFGWTVSLRLVAILGFLTAIVMLFVAVRNSMFSQNASMPFYSANSIPRRVYLGYALVGFSALLLQIAWTRLYGMLFLRTEYVLAILLAVFLLGIGFGSLVSRYFAPRIFAIAIPIFIVVAGFLGLFSLSWLGALSESLEYSSLAEALVSAGALVGLFTLPVTFAFGVWFPFLVNFFKADSIQSAKLYGYNSFGSAAGALAGAFLVLPLLGTTGSIVLALFLLLMAPFAWADKKYVSVSLICLSPLLVFVFKLPEVQSLQPKMFPNSTDIFVAEDAINITHVVEKADGERLLLADMQRMDASTEPSAVVAQKNQALLPLLFHPEPRSVLFLGLGTGITVAGSDPFPNLNRVAVEISEGAIDAAKNWFGEENLGVLQRTEIVRDDARRYLQTSNRKFDVIVGDLFHPDLVGRSSLLSHQQFDRVKNRLNNGGIFVQWIALNQFDLHSLTVVLRTFRETFEDSHMFLDGFRLGLLGLNEGKLNATNIESNVDRIASENKSGLIGADFVWTWAGRYLGPIQVEKGPVQDEWQPIIEFSIPKARYAKGINVSKALEYFVVSRMSVEDSAHALGIPDEKREQFERAFFGTELWANAMVATMNSNSEAAQRFLRLAYEANPSDYWIKLSFAEQLFQSISNGQFSDREKVDKLYRVLAVFSDHIESLKTIYHLELAANQLPEAETAKQRILRLNSRYRFD